MTKGIDVSHWQGTIDWNKVKAAGIEFAIIKAGGSDAGTYTDSKWEANYKGAKAAGIPIGAYYFVGKDCVTAAAGKADAERFIQILKGKQLEYPVYMDNEAQPASAKAGITEATIAFCETMEAAGYFVGIYGSAVSGFKERMDDSKLTDYAHWVAQYASKCSYKGEYGIWQYSSKGKVDGISGNVDLDYGYIDYPSIIKTGGFNGYAKENKPAPVVSSERDQVIAQARAWLGKNEADGSHKEIIDVYNSHKPLARGYKVKYTDAWCATFVSAVSIKCGLTKLIPTECGCGQMIELFQKLGAWNENDAYVPKPGDVIFYDWQDSGSGDNRGSADHVGVIEKVVGNSITVIEGNYKDAVTRRVIQVDGRYIRGYIVPDFSADTEDVDNPAKESAASIPGNYSLKTFIIDAQMACGAAVDGIAGPETIGKTVTLSSKKNRTHKAVVAVQKRLYSLGYVEVGKADGIAGPKFTSAVAHFQTDNGCIVDGEITAGKKTWRKLLGMA